MRRPSFGTPTHGSPSEACCQYTDDLDSTPIQYCQQIPVFKITNRHGTMLFVACLAHAYQARTATR